MAGTFPLIRNGLGSALYGFTRRVVYNTIISQGANGTEQRAKGHAPLSSFVLPYTNLIPAEVTLIRSFFNSQKGQFDSTWSLTLGATTYTNLCFEDDDLSFNEQDSMLYSSTLRCRQTENPGVAIPAAASDFPSFDVGLVAQRPYTQIRRFYTLKNDNPSGERYAYSLFGGGLAGFPTGALLGWTLEFPELSDANLLTLETFFRGKSGRYGSFNFTDPDNATRAANCRFGNDVLEIKHHDFQVSSTAVSIVQTNG